ncbi:uncharacterized protein LOC111137249 isoform X2 [Crassostrea virginica]
MDRWTLIAVLFCGIISYSYGQTGCQDSPSANCSSYNSDMICDSQGVFYLWARDNCPLHCGFCQRLSTRSTVLTSTDPGEKTLKPKFIPGTKTLSKGTERLSTKSTVLTSTDTGEKTLKPKFIPGTKTLLKGTEGLSTRSTVLTSTDTGEKTLKPKSIPGTKTLLKGTEGLSTRSTVLTSTDTGEKTLKPKSIPGTKTLTKRWNWLSTRSTVLTSTDPGEKTLKPKSIPGTKTLSKGTEGCQDSPSANCSMYNSHIICDTQGTYYLWAKENCPLHCAFCQGVSTRSTVSTSTGPGETTLKPTFSPGTKTPSKRMEGVSTRSTVSTSTGPGETTLKPTFSPGTKNPPKGTEGVSTRSTVSTSTGPGETTLKPTFSPGTKETEGVSTRSTVSTSTGPGETTLKPTFSPGTKTPWKGIEVGHNVGRDNNKGCGPDISLSFRGGVRDTSGNRAAVDYSGVALVNGTACFDGSSRLYIWRYKSYDYRDKLQISFKFKPTPGPRIESYTLVSNCEGNDEPSYGIGLNRFSNITTMFLKTDESEDQSMSFDINPTTWNDVYFRYQNGTMIGIVNTEIKTRSLIGNIQKRPDAMVFAHCKQYGNYRGLLKDIVVYSNCLPPLDKHVDSYLNVFT